MVQVGSTLSVMPNDEKGESTKFLSLKTLKELFKMKPEAIAENLNYFTNGQFTEVDLLLQNLPRY